MTFAALNRWVGKKTLKRQYALGAALVWLGVTIRVVFFSDIATIAALEAPYATLTTAAVLLVGYAVGLQQYDNLRTLGRGEPPAGGQDVSQKT